ncbi:MAG: hypothetical protein K2X77_13415 [Candidatus Obscuribacterales bacterium]|jgi:Na+-transporting methylmalonyl-CoA/oxaloacetate decarboxylase gamma subunit|nr:hypothetical protein [Candidatus Obscuribacterales bacterium]
MTPLEQWGGTILLLVIILVALGVMTGQDPSRVINTCVSVILGIFESIVKAVLPLLKLAIAGIGKITYHLVQLTIDSTAQTLEKAADEQKNQAIQTKQKQKEMLEKTYNAPAAENNQQPTLGFKYETVQEPKQKPPSAPDQKVADQPPSESEKPKEPKQKPPSVTDEKVADQPPGESDKPKVVFWREEDGE